MVLWHHLSVWNMFYKKCAMLICIMIGMNKNLLIGLAVLSKLNTEGSIFTKEPIIVMDKPTTEHFDYIMMFSNSKAAEKY